jgi:hypothetical protein
MRSSFDDDSDNLDPDEQANLDRDFPLGDGTADTTAEVMCPYCGEMNEVAVDPGGGDSQEYVEDCQVCCQPWRVVLQFVDGEAEITAVPLDQ